MTAANFNSLFHYMKKEDIHIDKPEFLFQIESHPNYPTLLSVVDSLSFFNIKNGSFRVKVTDIDLLPNFFMTFLAEENGSPQICFIEKRKNTYFCTKDKKATEISKSALESGWQNIVLLIEKSECDVTKVNKNALLWILSLLSLTAFLLILYHFNTNLKIVPFFIFSLIGGVFSIAALKELFGTKIKLINDFCNITSSTSCTTIVESNKWEIFKIVNFSDLSIIFFASQFLGLLVFTVLREIYTFLFFLKIVFIISIPIILLSLYFQRFVEKKWCPICLVIIGVIMTEVTYIIYLNEFDFNISNESVILIWFIFITIAFTWSLLKTILLRQKDLKELQLKSNRFLRNYTVFKNNLLSKEKKKLPETTIVLGNKESKTNITIISNPFCWHCKGVHEILEQIIEKYYNDIQVHIIFKANLDRETDDGKKLLRTLYKIFNNHSFALFTSSLKHWFSNRNLRDWFNLYGQELTPVFDSVIQYHNEWCNANGYNFTPVIFINGREFPDVYERSDLYFFLNELIDDFDLEDIISNPEV